MKNFFLMLLLLATGGAALHAQEAKGVPNPPGAAAVSAVNAGDVLLLSEDAFDFGAIPQGKPVYHTFRIVNRGTAPLRLTGVVTTCGCTTPEWSKEPVAPGNATLVKVGFNAATDGPFEKYITIQYNESGARQVKIKGNVWKAPAGAAPPNASLQFIKQQIQ